MGLLLSDGALLFIVVHQHVTSCFKPGREQGILKIRAILWAVG